MRLIKVRAAGWVVRLAIVGWFLLPCRSRADWCGTLAGLCGPPAETPVYGLAVYNGDLVAVGSFYGIAPDGASYVARWSGMDWEPLGAGVNGEAYGAAVYSGSLIVGGYFGHAGGRPANSIARWDGNAWWPLGSGISDGFVQVLLPFGPNLIVGGFFHTAGGYAANMIAQWNGTMWAPMSAGMSANVESLVDYNGTLVAGGYFTLAGGRTANYIAAWNGTAWQPLGSGTNGSVGALAVYNGDLIAAGAFTKAGGKPASYIARWNGSEWYPLGTGVNDGVGSLTVYNGDLIAGGVFTMAGGDSAYAVARWDGTSWSAMGYGLRNNDPDYPGPGLASALAPYDGGLAAGGNFINPGIYVEGCIARWDDPAIGACCHIDGSCTVTTQADCPAPNGWQGSCTVCNPSPCPVGSWGACCLAGSGCVQVPPTACQQDGGVFQGYGVPCNPNPCPTSSTQAGEVARFLRPEPEPNPSAGPVTIRYGLAAPVSVDLDVLDVSGRRIRRLVSERENAGMHSVAWDSCDDGGRPVSSGIYMIRLEAGPGVLSSRLTLIR